MPLLSRFLFPAPQPSSYDLNSYPGELLWIPEDLDYGSCKVGDALPAIFLQSQNARYLILYFHSNGEDVGWCYNFAKGIRTVLEVHVLLVEYPGYGICCGESSEESLWSSARSALRFATEVLRHPAEDVIVMGRSLGASLACRLASTCECHGLILVSPFSTLGDAVSRYTGGLGRPLVGDSFNNVKHIESVKVPTLVVHGQQDRIVPYYQGQQVFNLCRHEKKLLVSPEDMGHNDDLLKSPEFIIGPMSTFFCLPDYSFVDMKVPEAAFDKRLCLQYHGCVEMTRGDAPLPKLPGDQEPPASSSGGGPSGPAGMVRTLVGAGGDSEDARRSPTAARPSPTGGDADPDAGDDQPAPDQELAAKPKWSMSDRDLMSGIARFIEEDSDVE